MKETIHVNIARQAFTLDQDAYAELQRYLNRIKSRLTPDVREETLADIEARIAEIFAEQLRSPMMVVTLDLVRRTEAQMGAPEDFGDTPAGAAGDTDGDAAGTSRPLTGNLRRSRNDRILAGVCGGIARHFSIDSSVVRLLTVLLVAFAGLSIWVYLILWIVMPEEERTTWAQQQRAEGQVRRLYRSQDRMIGGVLGGIAEYCGWEVGPLRIIVLILCLFGIPIIPYLLLWMVLPQNPAANR